MTNFGVGKYRTRDGTLAIVAKVNKYSKFTLEGHVERDNGNYYKTWMAEPL